jgi:hypothetical protein
MRSDRGRCHRDKEPGKDVAASEVKASHVTFSGLWIGCHVYAELAFEAQHISSQISRIPINCARMAFSQGRRSAWLNVP